MTTNDLHGMADLLQEMRNQGVESNDVTVKLLEGIKKRRSYEMAGKNGLWSQKWWAMGPVVEDWQRLYEGLEVVLQEQRERLSRAAEEERREREEAEGEGERDEAEGEGERDAEPVVEQPSIQMSA